MKTLIVEDDQVLSLMLQKMVERMECNVVDAVTIGEDAVDIARSNKIDLILMDIILEGNLYGIEAMKKIREDNNFLVVIS